MSSIRQKRGNRKMTEARCRADGPRGMKLLPYRFWSSGHVLFTARDFWAWSCHNELYRSSFFWRSLLQKTRLNHYLWKKIFAWRILFLTSSSWNSQGYKKKDMFMIYQNLKLFFDRQVFTNCYYCLFINIHGQEISWTSKKREFKSVERQKKSISPKIWTYYGFYFPRP